MVAVELSRDTIAMAAGGEIAVDRITSVVGTIFTVVLVVIRVMEIVSLCLLHPQS